MTGADAKTTVVTDIFAYVDDQMKHPMTLHSTVASAGYHVLVPSTATGSANTLDRAVQERSRQEPFYSRHSCQDYYCSQCNSLRCLSLRLAFDTVDACLFCALERIAKIGFNEQDLWATSYDEAHKAMIPQINRGIAKWIWKAVSFCRTTFPDHTWKQWIMTIPAKTEAVTQSIYNPADRGGTTIADKVANARNPPIFGLFLPDVVQPPAGSTYVRDEYRGDPDAARHETIALVQGRYATQLFSPSRREASHEDLPENGATTGPDSCSEHPSTGSIGSQCDRRINRGSSSPQEGENETLMVDATVPLELSNDEASIDPQAATQHDEPPPSSRVSPIADPESSDAVDLESTDAFDEQIEEIRKRTEQLRMRIQQDFQAEAAGAEKARDGCAIAKEYAGLNPAPNEESPLSSKIEQRLAKAKRVHDQRLANLTAVLRSTVPDEQADGT